MYVDYYLYTNVVEKSNNAKCLHNTSDVSYLLIFKIPFGFQQQNLSMVFNYRMCLNYFVFGKFIEPALYCFDEFRIPIVIYF